MNAFFEQYKGLVLSSAYLVFGLMLFGYAALYRDRVADIADTKVAMKLVKNSNKELETIIKATEQRIQTEKQEQTEAARLEQIGVRRMPVFLRRINSIANSHDVIVRTLTPSNEEGPSNSFRIEFTATYEKFLKFTAELESLNTVVQNLSVRAFDNSQVPPVHAVSFTIFPRNDAEQLSNARLAALARSVNARDKRNPFQRFAYHAEETRTDPLIDLTWIHNLTGIGKIGERRYATIDRLDYTVGSNFAGKTITEIFSERVYLEQATNSGTRRYVLRFRRSLDDIGKL